MVGGAIPFSHTSLTGWLHRENAGFSLEAAWNDGAADCRAIKQERLALP